MTRSNVGRLQNKSAKPLGPGELALMALIWQTEDGLRVADMQELMGPYPAPEAQERLYDAKMIENPLGENGDRLRETMILTERGEKVLGNEMARALEEAQRDLDRLEKSRPKPDTPEAAMKEHGIPGLKHLISILEPAVAETAPEGE